MRRPLCPRWGTLHEFCLNDMWDWNTVTHAHIYTIYTHMHTWTHPCRHTNNCMISPKLNDKNKKNAKKSNFVSSFYCFLSYVNIHLEISVQLQCHPSTAFSVTLTVTWKFQWQCIHQNTHKPSPDWPSQIQSCVYLLGSRWWQLRCTSSTPTPSVKSAAAPWTWKTQPR